MMGVDRHIAAADLRPLPFNHVMRPQGVPLTLAHRPLAGPPVPEHPLTGLRLLASILSNPVEAWSREHFEEPIVVNATAFGQRIVVSDPVAIKRVLVDNAENFV